jgi:hypothetical protein
VNCSIQQQSNSDSGSTKPQASKSAKINNKPSWKWSQVRRKEETEFETVTGRSQQQRIHSTTANSDQIEAEQHRIAARRVNQKELKQASEP